ncbi:MAG TPA: PadR family transcriptional regulator [Xanthobacteraceae bacterium]|nr:PadR family transcriptional regulator [Xanthobacteraceae bacterium]
MHRHHGHDHYGRDENRGGKWGAGRHGHRSGFGRHGRFGGRHGGPFGGPGGMDDDTMRARRMLAQGDLRLLALALIAQAPRHGYEIIKLVEEKTADWYSPSPGIVYPTLTFLEEAGYVTAATEGSKKLYTITKEGRAYLDANGDVIKVVLERLEGIGERVNRWRRKTRGDDESRRELPPVVEATLTHLREAVAKRLDAGKDSEARLVEILARTVTELQRD